MKRCLTPWRLLSNEIGDLMLSLFRNLMKNQQGATVVEFTLIVSLIAVAAIASMRSVSSKVSNVLTN
jgi:pilus assembly protein Flp/PilA